ncbi:hypothetical protein EUGRSUZ_A00870 [Eucalyptus grandis]|uniref:Uncharacterized protein n=2 Tax=Eucalyptus grandis TaxID=71139 RepID=A0ACC3M125_EUCGR|nr:hypothetical protein EUGRSUZ_A00870 [Eucalyptus grandis]
MEKIYQEGFEFDMIRRNSFYKESVTFYYCQNYKKKRMDKENKQKRKSTAEVIALPIKDKTLVFPDSWIGYGKKLKPPR